MKGYLVNTRTNRHENIEIKVDEVYEIEQFEDLVEEGFQFFNNIADTAQFCDDYLRDTIFEINTLGFVEDTDIHNMYVTNKMEVLRIVSFKEIKDYYWRYEKQIANSNIENWYVRMQLVMFDIHPEQFSNFWHHGVKAAVKNKVRYTYTKNNEDKYRLVTDKDGQLFRKFIHDEVKELYRIEAIRDFADVKSGDFGGYVESALNLSHDGYCWIYDDSIVMEEAKISGDAKVYNNSDISGNVTVYGSAKINKTKLYGKILICETVELNNCDIFTTIDDCFELTHGKLNNVEINI